MSVSITKIQPASPGEWDRLWRQCDYATYFQSRDWALIWQAHSRGVLHPSATLLSFSDGTQALLPNCWQSTLRGFSRHYLLSPAGTYGGWLSSDALGPEHAELLLHHVRSLGNITWRLNPYDPLARGLAGSLHATPDETHFLALEPGFEAIFKRWSKGHSSAAKKARREGVLVREATDLADWRVYYQVYEDSLRRWGDKATSRYDWRLFQEIYARRGPNVRLWLASFKDEIIAGALVFYGPRHVVYWHGASLESHFQLRPVQYLLYEVIQAACNRGYAWFDFNPSGGHEGVKDFKRSFGTDTLPAPVLIAESPTTHRVRAAAQRIRAVLRR